VLKITFYKLTDICVNLCEHPTTEIFTSFASVEPRVCKQKRHNKNGDADLSTGLFWGPFTKLRKASISFVLSVSPHGTTLLPLDEFSFKLIFELFNSYPNWRTCVKFHFKILKSLRHVLIRGSSSESYSFLAKVTFKSHWFILLHYQGGVAACCHTTLIMQQNESVTFKCDFSEETVTLWWWSSDQNMSEWF